MKQWLKKIGHFSGGPWSPWIILRNNALKMHLPHPDQDNWRSQAGMGWLN